MDTETLSRAVWRKSTRSGGNGSCVEVASNLPDVIAVRDSKDPGGPSLVFNRNDWRAFIAGAQDGQFDVS
jgi:Domain of unknown function (DUF397)